MAAAPLPMGSLDIVADTDLLTTMADTDLPRALPAWTDDEVEHRLRQVEASSGGLLDADVASAFPGLTQRHVLAIVLSHPLSGQFHSLEMPYKLEAIVHWLAGNTRRSVQFAAQIASDDDLKEGRLFAGIKAYVRRIAELLSAGRRPEAEDAMAQLLGVHKDGLQPSPDVGRMMMTMPLGKAEEAVKKALGTDCYGFLGGTIAEYWDHRAMIEARRPVRDVKAGLRWAARSRVSCLPAELQADVLKWAMADAL